MIEFVFLLVFLFAGAMTVSMLLAVVAVTADLEMVDDGNSSDALRADVLKSSGASVDCDSTDDCGSTGCSAVSKGVSGRVKWVGLRLLISDLRYVWAGLRVAARARRKGD